MTSFGEALDLFIIQDLLYASNNGGFGLVEMVAVALVTVRIWVTSSWRIVQTCESPVELQLLCISVWSHKFKDF